MPESVHGGLCETCTLKISQDPDEAKESFDIPWQLRDDEYIYNRDLTIKCKGEVFPAHRVIVCSLSPYFAAACKNGFQESEKNEIILDDHNPFRIRKMLEFMYRGDYIVHVDEIQYLDKPEHMRPFPIKSEPEAPEKEETESDPGSYHDPTWHRTRNLRAIFHAQMYSVGDYFQILRLQSWAYEEFYREFTPVAFARYAEGQEAFCMAVNEVYSSTPPSNPGLRRVVVRKTLEKLCCWRRAENPILNRETLRRVPEFAIDVCVEALDCLNDADE